MEIERKFRISRLPNNIEQYDKKEIEQAYLCVDPVVRIRKSNEEYYMTYKSPIKKDSDILVNQEVEVNLTKDSYDHLRKKADYNLISKTRYLIPLEDGHTAELDCFHGILEGLTFVEVEFASEKDANAFNKPDWFAEDVSRDKRYKNNYLIQINDIKELNF